VPSVSIEIERLAQGHAGEGDPMSAPARMVADGKLVMNPQLEWTGGGYASTSRELASWAREAWSGRVVPAELLPEVEDGVAAPMLGKNVRYGLGVILRETRHGRTLGHSGYFPGYLTEMRWYREPDLGVAIQLNTSDFKKIGTSTGKLIDELVDIVLAPEAKPKSK
jgi:D-alanyl-D-alanine carboxypeptidase